MHCNTSTVQSAGLRSRGTRRSIVAVATQVLPSELFPAHTAVEYVLSQPVVAPPAFVFVVDVAGDAADLEVGYTSQRPCKWSSVFRRGDVMWGHRVTPTENFSRVPECTRQHGESGPHCRHVWRKETSIDPVFRVLCQGLKGAIRQVLQQLPEYALVGLVTFGSMVHGESRA